MSIPTARINASALTGAEKGRLLLACTNNVGLVQILNDLPDPFDIDTLRGLIAPSTVPATAGGRALQVLIGQKSVTIDGIISPVNITSPTSTTSDAHLINKGFARFLRKPLSLDTSIVADHPMLVNMEELRFCPSLGQDEFVGTLPLNETEYYNHFSRYSLSGIQESSLKPGNKQSAQKIYPGAFNKKCCVTLPAKCQPELATRVKNLARAASGGEIKPIDEVAMEEQFQYLTIGMSDSYFSSEQYPDHQLFYNTPPIGCSTLGVGPMGMLFAAEWIGVVFFSIISQPFYAGSSNHRAALQMFDEMELPRNVTDPLHIPRGFLLNVNQTEKLGVAWGVLDGKFIKVIDAPYLLQKQQNVNLAFNKGDHKYREIVGEEACGHANWTSNSVFFYHLYKVMAVWSKVWSSECIAEDEKHRNVFVPVELLFGEFSVCLRSPYVGTQDAESEFLDDKDTMKPVVDAVLWLALTWQLLYIDIRPPNLRVCDGGDPRIRLVDYDDMVLLKNKPCCNMNTVCMMRKNEHVQKVFCQYKKLAELFDEAGATDVCENCKG